MGRLKGQDEINNGQDIIDSRDVIDRIEWLQPDRDALQQAIDDLTEELKDTTEDEPGVNAPFKRDEVQAMLDEAEAALDEYDEGDEGQELKALLALQEDAEGYAPDWRYGSTLIRDTYFEKYAQELAEDIGAIDKAASWPNTCIDWEQAAEELQQDYTRISFDGHDYWIR